MSQGVTSRLIGWLVVSASLLLGAQASTAVADDLDGGESARYLDSLRTLYLSSSTREVLLAHSNDLLSTYALRADYQVGQTRREDVRYRLSLAGPGELRIREEVRGGGSTEVRVHNRAVTVFGLDPFVQYQCPLSGPACTFYSPADGSPLLRILRNDSGAAELAKALSFLIRELQKG